MINEKEIKKMQGPEKYDFFRHLFRYFIYNDFQIIESGTSVCFKYFFSIPGLSDFSPMTVMRKPEGFDKNDKTLRALVFSLGMVELLSYWKCACPPKILIKCGKINEEQIDWWKKLYRKGLGEFFYKNGIMPEKDFVEISCDENAEDFSQTETPGKAMDEKSVLLPIGGGKDSIVTLEKLKADFKTRCFHINPTKATIETISVAKISYADAVNANRVIDPQLLELNEKGFLNGHTPFSAIVAFSATLSAYMNGIKYIPLSNESSANESTVPGTDINHQYSKSIEFENDFREYEKKYINSGTEYFSFLRPFSELKIAQMFSEYPQYFDVFRSCNAGSKTDTWCKHCPKCLYTYVILLPFLGEDVLSEIFYPDFLFDLSLMRDFEKLCGILPEKPFECVGERDEVRAALDFVIKRFDKGTENLPSLLKKYRNSGIKAEKTLEEYLEYFNPDNNVPEIFKKEF